MIRNGTVVDGSGGKSRRPDIGIRDGRIVQIGSLKNASARETIDASGLVVAPGFIDVHTHADGIASKPLAENFVRMGVTAAVAGNCGGSTTHVADTLDQIRAAGISINIATLVGHNSVRREVMGDVRRAMEELQVELRAPPCSAGAFCSSKIPPVIGIGCTMAAGLPSK